MCFPGCFFNRIECKCTVVQYPTGLLSPRRGRNAPGALAKLGFVGSRVHCADSVGEVSPGRNSFTPNKPQVKKSLSGTQLRAAIRPGADAESSQAMPGHAGPPGGWLRDEQNDIGVRKAGPGPSRRWGQRTGKTRPCSEPAAALAAHFPARAD